MKTTFQIARRVYVPVLVATVLCLCVASGAQETRPDVSKTRLIEGFEDLQAVKVTGGKLDAVEGAGGITQGQKAAQVPPGVTIQLTVTPEDLTAMPWLKIDAMTLQPIAYRLKITFDAKRFHAERVGAIQGGKDTLALPLSTISSGWEDPPEGPMTLAITNISDAAIILDNIRFDPAVKPPPGCVAVDFGPDNQSLWPGFSPASKGEEHVTWSGANTIRGYGGWHLDPLTGDFASPPPNGRMGDSLDLSTPTNAPAMAWVWVTHYGPNHSQPIDYGFKFRGNLMASHQFKPASKFLTSEGLLEGMDGAWTPQWVDTTYASHFSDLLSLSLPAGASRVDLQNCQLAGLVMGPVASRAALTTFMDTVKGDLTTYHRQFIVGYRIDPFCQIPPLEAEEKQGAILFDPGPDEAFSTTWRPEEAQRASVLKALTTGGGCVVVPVAIVPLKKSPLSTTVAGARTAEGKLLQANAIEVLLSQRVPRVENAVVQFQPWLLQRKLANVEAKTIVHAAVVVRVPPNTPPGEYKTSVRFSLGDKQADVPLEIEVLDLGPQPQPAATFSTLGPTNGYEFWWMMQSTLPAPQADALAAKVRGDSIDNGLNTFLLPGVSATPLTVNDVACVAALRSHPATLKGRAMFDIGGIVNTLREDEVQPGTTRHMQTLALAARKVNDLAAKAKLPEPLIYIGSLTRAQDVPNRMGAAADVVAGGGRPALHVGSGALPAPTNAEFKRFSPLRAMLTTCGPKDLGSYVTAFKALGGEKLFYVYEVQPDRYTTGFFAAGIGADGVYLEQVNTTAGPYNGLALDGRGLLAIQSDGELCPTVGCLNLWQGQDDFDLMQRAKAILEKAGAAKIDAADLEKAILQIKTAAAATAGMGFNPLLMRTAQQSPTQIETARAQLIRAAAAVAQQLKKPA